MLTSWQPEMVYAETNKFYIKKNNSKKIVKTALRDNQSKNAQLILKPKTTKQSPQL